MSDKKCPICGEIAEISLEGGIRHFVQCPICGRYNYSAFDFASFNKWKNELASYLFYNKKNSMKDVRYFVVFNMPSYFDRIKEEYYQAVGLKPEELESFMPKTFSDRIDRILLEIADKTKYFGAEVQFTYNELLSLYFVSRFDEAGNSIEEDELEAQANYIHTYLTENNYVNHYIIDNKNSFVITSDGWKRIDEIHKSSHTSTTAFVAMSFDNDMKNVREEIRKAITDCGYQAVIIDEKEYNGQIVPEMLYEIRKSRFVVADLTKHNNGAYYEAGYALGQGKEVIHLCKKDAFGSDGHFDVKQVNTVLWNDESEIHEKLSKRIKATIL